MKTRLKDVAEHLKLSPALVSGVLNNRPNVWASAETRSRILEVAKELNYHPSAAAQALSSGKTTNLAFVYRRLEDPDHRLAYTGLVDVFSAQLQAMGYDLIVSNFASQEDVLAHLERIARSRSVDAVILWGREQDTEEQGLLLERLGVPFLIKGRHEKAHPTWRQIDFDHEWMMRNAVEHLRAQGRKRLAYLGFPHEDAYVKALRRGFLDANGQESALMAACPDLVPENQRVIADWLRLPEDLRPDGFVIGAGNSTWLALETCLADIGERLGPNEKFGAAGIVSYSFNLMFGQAEVYQGIELDNLARQATPDLLPSLLQDLPCEPIVRFRPELTPAASLDLLSHGVSFTRDVRP